MLMFVETTFPDALSNTFKKTSTVFTLRAHPNGQNARRSSPKRNAFVTMLLQKSLTKKQCGKKNTINLTNVEKKANVVAFFFVESTQKEDLTVLCIIAFLLNKISISTMESKIQSHHNKVTEEVNEVIAICFQTLTS